jgi:hypothetical protein
LVLNSPELRSALKGISEGAATLTEAEWRAWLGLRREWESGAARQRRRWLEETLADSGREPRFAWGIIDRLKSPGFTLEELDAEIEAARERSAAAGFWGIVEVKGIAKRASGGILARHFRGLG